MSAGSLATRGKSQLKQARQAAIRRAAARSWFPLAGRGRYTGITQREQLQSFTTARITVDLHAPPATAVDKFITPDSATCLDRRWEPGNLGSSGVERGALARESTAVAFGCSGSLTASRPVMLSRLAFRRRAPRAAS